MAKIRSDESAYPTHGYSSGMDIQTKLASDAMQGILAGRDKDVALTDEYLEEVAKKAKSMAGILLRTLNEFRF